MLNIVISYFFLKAGFSPTVVMEIKCCLDVAYLVIRLLFMRAKIQFSLRDFSRQVLVPVSSVTVLSLIPMFILSFAGLSGWKHLFISIAVFVIVYAALVFLIGISRSEKERVAALVKRK